MLNFNQLFTSPGMYPLHINPLKRVVEFCEMDSDSYRRSPFLDHRIIKASARSFALPFDEIHTDATFSRPADVRIIYHSAFCCSTLLARYLDAISKSLVLREPHSLYELASFKRFYNTNIIHNVSLPDWDKLYQFIILLLSRRYASSHPVIIKPSDGCNNLMEELLNTNSENRGLFLYSDIHRFLVSVLKYEQRHEWARIRVRELTLDRQKKGMMVKYDPRRLTNWQTAALVWIYHIEMYNQTCQTTKRDKICALDSVLLLNRPVSALSAILRHFGNAVDDMIIEQALAEDEFKTHSKDPNQSYDEETRDREFKDVSRHMQNEIQAGLEWASETMGTDHTQAIPSHQLLV